MPIRVMPRVAKGCNCAYCTGERELMSNQEAAFSYLYEED